MTNVSQRSMSLGSTVGRKAADICALVMVFLRRNGLLYYGLATYCNNILYDLYRGPIPTRHRNDAVSKVP